MFDYKNKTYEYVFVMKHKTKTERKISDGNETSRTF